MKSVPVATTQIPPPHKKTVYPHPFASRVAGRTKRKLGDHFGLTNFGVNLTELAPGAFSARAIVNSGVWPPEHLNLQAASSC